MFTCSRPICYTTIPFSTKYINSDCKQKTIQGKKLSTQIHSFVVQSWIHNKKCNKSSKTLKMLIKKKQRKRKVQRVYINGSKRGPSPNDQFQVFQSPSIQQEPPKAVLHSPWDSAQTCRWYFLNISSWAVRTRMCGLTDASFWHASSGLQQCSCRQTSATSKINLLLTANKNKQLGFKKS